MKHANKPQRPENPNQNKWQHQQKDQGQQKPQGPSEHPEKKRQGGCGC